MTGSIPPTVGAKSQRRHYISLYHVFTLTRLVSKHLDVWCNLARLDSNEFRIPCLVWLCKYPALLYVSTYPGWTFRPTVITIAGSALVQLAETKMDTLTAFQFEWLGLKILSNIPHCSLCYSTTSSSHCSILILNSICSYSALIFKQYNWRHSSTYTVYDRNVLFRCVIIAPLDVQIPFVMPTSVSCYK